MALRVVFCGTPAFGVPALEQLIAAPDFFVEAVITQPDRPRGRGQKESAPAVKGAAHAAHLRVLQPEKIRAPEVAEVLREIAPDAVVIIAYGQIIPNALLEIPRLGWINLHASLLPKYRGAAPVQRAILAGETRTGLTVMHIDSGLDTGPILAQTEMEIRADETALELLARMSEAGAPLLLDTLRRLARGEIQPQRQNDAEATLAPPLQKSEGRIEWNAHSATEICNQMRALTPWPGTYTNFRGRICQLWGRPAEGSRFPEARGSAPGAIFQMRGEFFATCARETWLLVESVQLEGRKRMTAREFANGARLQPGEKFE